MSPLKLLKNVNVPPKTNKMTKMTFKFFGIRQKYPYKFEKKKKKKKKQKTNNNNNQKLKKLFKKRKNKK
jgi:hypothetical protein